MKTASILYQHPIFEVFPNGIDVEMTFSNNKLFIFFFIVVGFIEEFESRKIWILEHSAEMITNVIRNYSYTIHQLL